MPKKDLFLLRTKELMPSRRNANELLAAAALLAYTPPLVTMEELFKKAYTHNGEQKRNYHSNSGKRLKQSLKQTGVAAMDTEQEENSTFFKYAHNDSWVERLLETEGVFSDSGSSMNSIIEWTAGMFELKGTETARFNLYSPDRDIFSFESDSYSLKELAYETEASATDLNILYMKNIVTSWQLLTVTAVMKTFSEKNKDYMVPNTSSGAETNLMISKSSISERDSIYVENNFQKYEEDYNEVREILKKRGTSFLSSWMQAHPDKVSVTEQNNNRTLLSFKTDFRKELEETVNEETQLIKELGKMS